MNNIKQHKDFIFRSTRLLRDAQQWVHVSLEGFEGSLDTSEEALLEVCLLLLNKTNRALVKLLRWLNENPGSPDYRKVIFLVGGIRKLLASWSSGNIIR